MRKNKILAAVMAGLILTASLLFSGCNNSTNNSSSATEPTTAAATENPDDKKEENISYAEYNEYDFETDVPVKNIIVMVGDGMGLNHIKAAEIQKGDKLAMEGMPYKATVTTDSLSGTTDSAASATALACGIKTSNKNLGVDKDDNEVENVFEVAEKAGMKRGLAVTQVVPHATPAGFTVHYGNRDNYVKILSLQLNAGIDVMLGGGQQYYRKGIRAIVEEKDYNYISTPSELKTLTNDKKVLGMFKYENILAGYKPSLMDMTSKAIELLENDNGFILLVEGSDIDTRSHNSDMDGMLREMKIFDNTIDLVLKYASENPGTLVLVTADHETGGIKLPENATADDLTIDLFTSNGQHTSTNVGVFVAGACADKFLSGDVIDNTDIGNTLKKFINEYHKTAA